MGNTASFVLHFGVFEADLATGELRRNGRTVKLQPQPFRILALLLERQGDLVTREEIHQKLWGDSAIADPEHALNFVIKKIREALNDDADRPRYVETLPRRGYRFIAPVERVDKIPTRAEVSRSPTPSLENRLISIAEGFKPSHKSKRVEGAGGGALAIADPPDLDVSPAHTAPEESSGATAAPAIASGYHKGEQEHGKDAFAAARGSIERRHFAAGVAALVVAGVFAFLARPALPPPRVTGSTQVTRDGFDKERIVTDESRIYFSSYRRDVPALYQVFAAGGETLPVPTSVSSPFVFDVSPDHSELLVGNCYLGGSPSDCPLWILPLSGRSPHRLGNVVVSDATWSPDGKHVGYVKGNSLYRITTGGAESEKIASVASGSTLYWPRWSPDGSRLRFTVRTQSNGTSLWEVSADGKNLHPLLSGWKVPPAECCGTWTPDGKYFLFQSERGGNKNIWVIREESSVLHKAGHQPVQLTMGPTSATTAVPSADGRKVFVVTARSGELVRYDQASEQFAPYLSGLSATGVNFSRDGKWVTYVAYPEGTLWRSKADGSERLQLTFPPLYALQPRWSPDGTRIAFMALEPDKPWSVYVVSAEDGSIEQPVPGNRAGSDPTWSPDGNSLVFGGEPANEAPGAGTLDLKIVDLRTHTVSKVPGSEELWSPRWSPDGWQILALPRTGDQLLLFDVNNGRWTELAKVHASWPEWSRKGDYVYFTDASKGRSATGVFRVRISDHKLEQVASLNDLRQPVTDWGGWTGLAPDDSPLLLRDAGTQDIYALDVDWP